jgi:hypothetical protein
MSSLYCCAGGGAVRDDARQRGDRAAGAMREPGAKRRAPRDVTRRRHDTGHASPDPKISSPPSSFLLRGCRVPTDKNVLLPH